MKTINFPSALQRSLQIWSYISHIINGMIHFCMLFNISKVTEVNIFIRHYREKLCMRFANKKEILWQKHLRNVTLSDLGSWVQQARWVSSSLPSLTWTRLYWGIGLNTRETAQRGNLLAGSPRRGWRRVLTNFWRKRMTSKHVVVHNLRNLDTEAQLAEHTSSYIMSQ